jgi:molybdopterin-synthase adenylyltransferase
VKPLLPKHYRVRVETPEDGTAESLVFASEGKRVVLDGHAFQTFVDRVVPLLDGRHTLEAVQENVADVFAADDLEDCLALLAEHRVVVDADLTAIPADVQERLAPQVSYLREVARDPGRVIERLAAAEVTVVGLGAVGAVAATALAASNVGKVRCVDGAAVSASDPFLAQIFRLDDVGRPRAEVTCERIRAVNPATSIEVVDGDLQTDEDVAAAIAGSDFVLGCLDPGLAAITYKLNRACLSERISWSAGTVSAFEGIVGPTVIPHETACYLCYQMRAIACADDPEGALADLGQRDRSRTDESPQRENLAFGAGIVGNLLALEAFKALTGERPTTAGRIAVVDLAGCTMRQHVVLRHPSCAACFPC